MGNASFRKSERIQKAVDAAGCLLEYLPPYLSGTAGASHPAHSTAGSVAASDLKSCFLQKAIVAAAFF